MNKELKNIVKEMEKVCKKHINKATSTSRYGCYECPLSRRPYCLKKMVENNDLYIK